MKLYHATYGVYLDSILKKGLIPNYKTNWDFSGRYIYLTSDPDIAQDFAETADMAPEEYLNDIVILEIDIKDLDENKLRLDDNITQDEDNEEPYSFQYIDIIKPELLTVYDRIKEETKVKQFDKALVNYYVNIGLSERLAPIIKQYRSEIDIDECRGQCYNEADKFIYWLQDNDWDLFLELQDMGLQRVDGLFVIDDPEKLPLEFQDLEQDEYEEFLNLYDDDIDPSDPEDISYYIWQYLQEYADEDRLGDFYAFNHAWIDIDGYIIDFSWPQFKEAIDNTGNLEDRYEY